MYSRLKEECGMYVSHSFFSIFNKILVMMMVVIIILLLTKQKKNKAAYWTCTA